MTEIVNLSNIKCPQSKPVKFICINSKCHNNCFSCINQQCISCQQNHEYCKTFFFKTYTDQLNAKKRDISQLNRNTIEKIIDIINDSIKYLQQMRDLWKEKLTYYGFSNQQIEFAKQTRTDYPRINGQEMSQIFKTLRKQYSVNAKPNKIEKYWKNMEKIFQSCFDFQKIAEKQTISLDSKIICENKNLEEYNSSEKVVQANNKISNFFNMPISDAKLIYRASQQHFITLNFCEKLKNVSNTLILAKTQHNKIIGGYNPYPWVPSDWNIYDKSKQLFLFSLTQNKKYKLKNPKSKALQYKSNGGGGPIFGENSFSIGNNSNTTPSSICNIVNQFESQDNKQITKQEQTKFSGNQNIRIIIKEWQVFKLQFPVNKKQLKKLLPECQVYLSQDSLGNLFGDDDEW